MSYDLDAMRAKVRSTMSGRRSDPDEFRPAKAEAGKELKYRFFILPPYKVGDQLREGVSESDLGTFFLQYGMHFGICRPPQPCPRVISGEPCPICDHGFALMKEAGDDRDARKAIGKDWMPATYHVVNIYFPAGNGNPSELEGRVLYYKAPKTCVDIWVAALERTGPGDAIDPQAYGGFFDENAAFMFQLSCKVKGQNNTYESSMFLPNGGSPMAIAPDEQSIANILSARFELSKKVDYPDMPKLNAVAQNLINGVDMDQNNGFSAPGAAPVQAAAPVATAPAQAVVHTPPVQPAPAAVAAPVAAAPVAAAVAPAPAQTAPAQTAPAQTAPAQTAPVAAATPAPVAPAAPAPVAPAATPSPAPAATTPVATPAETVQPAAEGGGGDDVMSEIESMLDNFDN